MDRCIDSDALERYAQGRSADPEAAPLEEHILVCHACQDRLRDTDEYVRVIVGALALADRA